MTWSVYEIRCVPSGCVYVGVTRDADAAWKRQERMLRKGRHPNVDIQAAWDFYGPADFAFLALADEMSGEDAEELAEMCVDAARACDRTFNRPAGVFERTPDLRLRQSAAMRGRKPSNLRGVVAAGVVYESVRDAARRLGVVPGTVQYRLRSPRWPEWRYADAG